MTRTFPIEFDGSGDIVYPDWAYPYRGWLIPSWAMGLLALGAPTVVYLAAQLRLRSLAEATSALMGSHMALLLATLAQLLAKVLVGGFRPYFLDVCMPDVARAAAHNASRLNAVGFRRVMYSTDVCTQPDAAKLHAAVTGFPSGHAAAAAAAFGFLFLWLNAQLKVWADARPAAWKLAAAAAPLVAALLVAGTLTVDAAHNWYDVVGGGAIGALAALGAYRASYAAVWDWRYNHVPLSPAAARAPGGRGVSGPAQGAGWGGGEQRVPERAASLPMAGVAGGV